MAASLLAAGCTKEYVTKEYYEETIIQGTEMTLIDFTVNKWEMIEDGGYFAASLPVPEITKDVVNKGNVQVSLRLLTENGAIAWTPLPTIRVFEEDGITYSVYTDYEWLEGLVKIFVTASDLFTGEKPDPMDFRVAIIM